ncbi:guanylate cyclase, putative [Bodo saltans]|uniref:Guanylate cyclase, putative n=1 Tax=Bodo saltans TaxID=75058 RepID=A0A0S4IU11_BODSA|nr:guanylate cyclase, putative [Bodo saltans]|eukprot:CUF29174.1 guanylate cyclase, putative [Bodo saltans]
MSRVIDPADNSKKFLEFIGKLASLAGKLSLNDALGDLGFRSDIDSLESSTSSFSFAMQDGSAQSFAANRPKKVVMSSDLAHRSWTRNANNDASITPRASKEDDEVEFVPFVGDAVIMFVDLSGYSKIAAALTNQGGAHALSSAVNTYFESILEIVQKYGGDVISFAGDAICVCWPCGLITSKDCAVLACCCADELQRKCGVSTVQGTDEVFRMHIGITMGEIESEILACNSSVSMQKAFHFVWGEPLSQTALVVEAAHVGEIAATIDVKTACGEMIVWEKRKIDEHVVFMLKQVDDEAVDFVQNMPRFSTIQHSDILDKNLVPPQVSKKLRQGFKPSHLAEMRFLCVLFIRKQLTNVSALEWFSEVQGVLDENRCPIVQIIHDDKGTHLIAAVNLYRMERDPIANAIRAARTLVDRETGCAIGIACGEVFCGITGADQACRWDITGPACVRACRLMQHGVANNIDVVLDESIQDAATDLSQFVRVADTIVLKGSPLPVSIFVLSQETREVTSGVLSMSWTNATLHKDERQILLTKLLQTKIQRGVAMVSGPIGAGKKTSALIALEQAQFAHVTHFSTPTQRPLAMLSTVAQWFKSYSDVELSKLGRDLCKSLLDSKLTMSLNLFHQIVDKVVVQGRRFCYIIAYATLLDSASLNLIRSVIGSRPTKGEGRFVFCLTAYPLHRTRSPEELLKLFERQAAENRRLSGRLEETSHLMQHEVPHVKFTYPKDSKTFAVAFAGVSFFQLTERSSNILFEATGGCLLFVRPLLQAMGSLSFSLHGDQQKTDGSKYLYGTVDGTIHVTTMGEDYFMREINWPRVAPLATSRFTELYDVLSPRLQLILRVVASLSTTTGSANPYHVFKVMEKLNAKVTSELIFSDIHELVELEILKDVATDGGEYCFAVPAMVDVLMGLLTPDQDRMLKRQAFKLTLEYAEGEGQDEIPPEHKPIFSSFVARLAKGAGDMRAYKKFISLSWDLCLAVPDNSGLTARMEERLSTENRRSPDFCNRELFKNSSRIPLLEKFVSKSLEVTKPVMPHLMKFFATGFLPPMALGAISGEYQKMGWWAICQWLETTKDPEREFLPKEQIPFLRVDLDKYFSALVKFEEIIPQDDTPEDSSVSDLESLIALDMVFPMSLEEERKLLDKALTLPKSSSEAEEHCNILMHYYYKVLLPRRGRLLKYTLSMQTLEDAKCEGMSDTDCAIGKAFRRFLHPNPIPDCVVHDALLDLATAGWSSKYFNVNLQLIRELIFKDRLATANDFKAYLLSLKIFGQSITEATKY